MKAVVLLSGGLDSTTTLATAINRNFDPIALSFNYGQRHREMELGSAIQIAGHYGVEHHIIDLRSVGKLLSGSALTDSSIAVPDGHYEEESMKATVVPNRNAIMLSIAFGIARARNALYVFAGMHAGDHAIYPDCRPEFVTAFHDMELYANADLEVTPLLATPFIHRSKYQIVQEAAKLGVPFELTYSCYKGQKEHCGTCGTCTERREAFQLAGVTDPTTYATVSAGS